ncbi:MAG: RNA pyrophosphohydrolase [Pseudomonadota bacterium]
MTDLSLYRPNIGVALFNGRGQVWIGHRASETIRDPDDPPDAWMWQMPQGGIDKKEAFEPAARRELQEETGVTSAELLLITPGWLTYDFPEGYTRKGRVGQRQKWAAMLFRGDEAEIDLETDDTPEFDAWRWAELEETPDLIVPFKREVYVEVVEAFRPLRNLIRNGVLR